MKMAGGKAVIIVVLQVLLAAGSAQAASFVVEWSRGLGGGLAKVLAVEDTDGDGMAEAVVENSAGLLEILKFTDGEWRSKRQARLSSAAITSAVAGDIDGDGSREIIVTNAEGGDTVVSVFDASTLALEESRVVSRYGLVIKGVMDADGDGEAEGLFASGSEWSLRKPRYCFDSEIWTGFSHVKPVISDVDNDGKNEIVCAENIAGTKVLLSVYDAAKLALEWTDTLTDKKALGLAAGNVDTDDSPEIVIYSEDAEETICFDIYDGRGRELEYAHVADEYTSHYYDHMLGLEDIDDDGISEVAFYFSKIEKVELLDAATLESEWSCGSEPQNYFVDIDGDGIRDIAYVYYAYGDRRLVVVNIAKNESREGLRGARTDVKELYFANIDGDGQLEAVYANSLTVVDGLTLECEEEGYWYEKALDAGDVDGDGYNEFVIAKKTQGGRVEFEVVDCRTKLLKSRFVLLENVYKISHLFIGDADGDGIGEIFVNYRDTSYDTQGYIIRYAGREVIWHGSGGSYARRIMDVDGDGDDELISDNYVYDVNTKESEWRIPGSGSFIDAVDVDSDGVIEIVRAVSDTSWSDRGHIYVIDCLTRQIEWEKMLLGVNETPGEAGGLESVAVADVDNDGSYEIIYGGYYGNIHILDGITKAEEGTFKRFTYHHGLGVGDVDYDGQKEIAATDGWNAWNYLYIIDGMAYKTEWKSAMSLGQEVHGIEVSDLDSDGVDDIMATGIDCVYMIGLNRSPVFGAMDTKEIKEGRKLVFDIPASDRNDTPLIYAAEDLPPGAFLTGKTFGWRPNYNQSGTYYARFSISDGIQKQYKNVKIIVHDVENTVRNPDIEEGYETPYYWVTYNNTLSAKTGWAADERHSGGRSLKIVNTQRTKAGWYGGLISFAQPYPDTLAFEGWAKAQGVSGDTEIFSLSFYVEFTDGTHTWYREGLDFSKGTHGWERALSIHRFDRPVKRVRPYCLFYGGNGTAWFDDISTSVHGSVINPDMEAGSGVVSGWQVYGDDPGEGTSWASDAYYSRRHSLKIVNTHGGNIGWRGQDVYFSDPYPIALTFSGWAKSKDVKGPGAAFRLDFYVEFTDGTYVWYHDGLEFEKGTHDWAKVESYKDFKKPIRRVRPYCALNRATGTVWFDDIYMDVPRGVINSNMEEGPIRPLCWRTYNNRLSDSGGWVTDAYRSAGHSLKVVNTQGLKAGWEGQEVYFTKPYPSMLTFGGWAKALNVGNEVTHFCLSFRAEFEDGAYTWFCKGLDFTKVTHGWEKVESSHDFKRPIKSVRPYCLLYGGSGTAWFDDIYISK